MARFRRYSIRCRYSVYSELTLHRSRAWSSSSWMAVSAFSCSIFFSDLARSNAAWSSTCLFIPKTIESLSNEHADRLEPKTELPTKAPSFESSGGKRWPVLASNMNRAHRRKTVNKTPEDTRATRIPRTRYEEGVKSTAKPKLDACFRANRIQ